MKKLKLGLMAAAIVVAVSSAFASKPPDDLCYMELQYWYNGSYHEAGEYGLNYYCSGSTGVCTYWRPDPVGQPNYYQACKIGTYNPINPMRKGQ